MPAGLAEIPGAESSLPFDPEASADLTTPRASKPVTDGLSAFVQRIRTPYPADRGQCTGGLDRNLHSRLFGGKPVPVEQARPFDVPAIRKDFPILHQQVHGKPLVWLDNAATTQKPQNVIDAVSRFYAYDNSNIHRGAHTLAARSTDAFEQARQKIQAFSGASSSKEIVFVRGSTEGINLVTQTYGRKFLQPGDEIVLSTLEHHANIVPWQMVAKEKGAVLRVIPVTDRGEVMLEAYEAILGPRTKVVALTHASNSLGTILPVAEMAQMAKRYNARVLIDGAQTVAHMPLNVQQLGADFFVFSGHKIFGPTGIGVVYAKEELLEIMPPWQGGGSMIRNVTFEETTFAEPPAKFEAGTPNVADAVGLARRSTISISLDGPLSPNTNKGSCNTPPRSSLASTVCASSGRQARRWACYRSSFGIGRPRKSAGSLTLRASRCARVITAHSRRYGVSDWRPRSGRRLPCTTRRRKSIGWPMP